MILEIFVASASTVLKIIAALLVGAFMYGICFFFIYITAARKMPGLQSGIMNRRDNLAFSIFTVFYRDK